MTKIKKFRLAAEKVIEKAADETCHLFDSYTLINCGTAGFCLRFWNNGAHYQWFEKPLNLKEL